jgi:hypothetical protein
MKKFLITTALGLSALSLIHAQETTAEAMPQALPPMVTTGDTTVDQQIRTLHKEMEAKIKALRDEYQTKIKAIVGEKKPVIVRPDGSTTTPKEARKEIKEVRQELKMERKETQASTTASTTPARKGFFRNLFNR